MISQIAAAYGVDLEDEFSNNNSRKRISIMVNNNIRYWRNGRCWGKNWASL